ncbi:MAG: hypothetical protein WD077_09330 [Bacteroidia bacterium]
MGPTLIRLSSRISPATGQLSIYNRCGETIWKGENEGWDGTVASCRSDLLSDNSATAEYQGRVRDLCHSAVVARCRACPNVIGTYINSAFQPDKSTTAVAKPSGKEKILVGMEQS